MADRHLTDSELQMHLDGRLASETPLLVEHLKVCPLCAARLREYRSLYVGLGQTTVAVSEGFADRVAARTIARERAEDRRKAWNVVLAGLGFAVMAAVAAYYADPMPLLARLWSFDLSPMLSGIGALMPSKGTADGALLSRLWVFVPPVAVLLLLVAFDSLLRASRRKSRGPVSFLV